MSVSSSAAYCFRFDAAGLAALAASRVFFDAVGELASVLARLIVRVGRGQRERKLIGSDLAGAIRARPPADWPDRLTAGRLYETAPTARRPDTY
jgi:hypothetical protein